MTFTLIVVSCLLARILPYATHHALLGDITEALGANGALVAASIAGLTALAHAARDRRRSGATTGLAVRRSCAAA